MNDKITLVRVKAKGGVYYVRDRSETNQETGKAIEKRYSLGTKDEKLAKQIFHTKYGFLPDGNAPMAKMAHVYLQAMDNEFTERTWDFVYQAQIDQGQTKTTIDGYIHIWKQPIFNSIRNKLLAKTTKFDILAIFKKAVRLHQKYLITLHNFAHTNGWLVDKLLTRNEKVKLTKKTGGNTASLGEEEYPRILEAIDKRQAEWETMKDRGNIRSDKATHAEFRDWVVTLWHTGAANQDAVNLTIDNVNFVDGTINFDRKKWVGTATGVGEKNRDAVSLKMTKELYATILKRVDDCNAREQAGMKNYKSLFPKLSIIRADTRLRIFEAYLKRAEIPKERAEWDGRTRKVVIHSFRYGLAMRMAMKGVPERDAMRVLGHSSQAVHNAYARLACSQAFSMDDYYEDKPQDPPEADIRAA